MNEAMKVTQDYQHCFVENLRYVETDWEHDDDVENGVHILEIIAGS